MHSMNNHSFTPNVSVGKRTPKNVQKRKSPGRRGFQGVFGTSWEVLNRNPGGVRGIRTLDEALHPILP